MKVLIVGAGIAGPTLAYWLRRSGHEPTLLEQAPKLREGGYLVDFWGSGFEVAERMGHAPRDQDRRDRRQQHRDQAHPNINDAHRINRAEGFGLRLLGTASAFLGRGGRTHLKVWNLIFILICLQMTTALRPIIGAILSLLLTLANPPGGRHIVIGISSDDYMIATFAGLVIAIGYVMTEAARLAEDNKQIV